MRIFFFQITIVVFVLANWSSSQKENEDVVQIGGTVQSHNNVSSRFEDFNIERASNSKELVAYGAPADEGLVEERFTTKCPGKKSEGNPNEKVYVLASNPKDVEFRINLRFMRTLEVVDSNTVYKIDTGSNTSRRYTKVKIEMAHQDANEQAPAYFLVPEETRFVFATVPEGMPLATEAGKKSSIPMHMYVKAIKKLEITNCFMIPKRSEEKMIVPGMQCTIIRTEQPKTSSENEKADVLINQGVTPPDQSVTP